MERPHAIKLAVFISIAGGLLSILAGISLLAKGETAPNNTNTFYNVVNAPVNTRVEPPAKQTKKAVVKNPQPQQPKTDSRNERFQELLKREGWTHVSGDNYKNKQGGVFRVTSSKDGNGLVINLPRQNTVQSPTSQASKQPKSSQYYPPVQGAPTPDDPQIKNCKGQLILLGGRQRCVND